MPDMPEAVLTPRQAAMAEEILVPLDRAEGKIAAAAVGLYPPGIPLLAPGERVTREIISIAGSRDAGALRRRRRRFAVRKCVILIWTVR